MQTAFIVRPFGTKNGVDFDRVERELIAPALEALGVPGRTTAEIAQAGNIREDMFQRLIAAELVIADVSIHNANVFYELGIRHGLRRRSTFLIRCAGDEVPFDLRTDRYCAYDANDPGGCLEALTEGLRATLASDAVDSPVFKLLPGLERVSVAGLRVVPAALREAVELARRRCRPGELALLGNEAKRAAATWSRAALRLVADALFEIAAPRSAKTAYEALIALDPSDEHAGLRLGTIYQRLGEIDRSDQVVERVVADPDMDASQLAEAHALLASNAKRRWVLDWQSADPVREKALTSPHLERATRLYARAYARDLNNFYPGINELVLLTIRMELARALPQCWADSFADDEDAARALAKLERRHARVAATLESSIRAREAELGDDGIDAWLLLTRADFRLLTSDRPAFVARSYADAIAQAGPFAIDAVRQQLAMLELLEVRSEGVAEALAALAGVDAAERDERRILLFAGHLIDGDERTSARFPAAAEAVASARIRERLATIVGSEPGHWVAFAGAANGGDILFHEACAALDVESRIRLPLPANEFVRRSVAPAGAEWVSRFERLLQERQVSDDSDNEAFRVLSASTDLPSWTRDIDGYSVWERGMVWLLESAESRSTERLTVLLLWDGRAGDGPGGTGALKRAAEERGARIEIIDAADLAETAGAD